MRHAIHRFSAAVLAAAALLAASGAPSAAGETEGMTGFVRVSPRDGRYLELSDGRPYVPVGLNMIQPPGGAKRDDLGPMADWITSLSANRGNFIRIWMGAAYFDVEHSRSGQYDPARADRIARLLALCRRRGVRVKMCLESFRTLKGGKEWARKPLHLVEHGGPARDAADFFAGEASRRQFKRKLAWLADRFRDEPAVFGWELWNEVNCVRGADWHAWSDVMLAELQRLFPKHLAMQSLGSFDGDWALGDYPRLVRLPGNDVAQVHRYLDCGARYEICHGPVDVLAADAVRRIREWQPDRPILLAESGAVEPRHSGPFRLYAKDTAGILLHDVLFAPFFAGAAGPGHIWHWDHYVARNDLWWHFGRFAEVIEGIDPPAENFRPGMVDHPRLRTYTLAGRRTFLAWLRDIENTWRTELADGRPPETVNGASLALPGGLALDGARIRTYDPWKDAWAPATAAAGKVPLPAFTRSLVVRIDFRR
jgi:hypothetical protein